MTGFQGTPFKPATQSDRYHVPPQRFTDIHEFKHAIELKTGSEEWIASQTYASLEFMR